MTDTLNETNATDVDAAIAAKADRARFASRILAQANRDHKDRALHTIGETLDQNRAAILAGNEKDLARGEANGTSQALLDRLRLDDARIDGLISALQDLSGLPDPVGEVMRGQTLPNGLRLRQIHVPLGVVGAIYEARPNVTVDIAGIALKSGNTVLLRGGSAAEESNKVLIGLIREALEKVGLPADAVQGIDELGRPGATALMGARGKVDVLVPRGGHNLIQAVVQNATVPVIETGEGNVHVFVDESAPEELAVPIVLNAKTHRTSVCNAAETLLIHQNAAVAPKVLKELSDAGVRLHVDERAAKLAEGLNTVAATAEDWDTEYLDMDIAVAVVDSLDDAMDHIRAHSSGHTEAIVTNDLSQSERFVREIDSAAVIVNASTRFTDGGQLGLGAEVGISTQKMHARGPMGLRELTTTKWVIQGDGQIRP
ncbi:glutamate-5-semialdehyde dehydrogenase [Zhihengliuella flava]|uniref:Gamma-glutamyl phosphate reductase n=1 Tax=Zhihengliuella flava TaxID=1285193 RepID=A0A931D6K2_9MICC|nr:glutamate-5-semialdehyde dehydrogenase [Zhihengliuella flava]MBG6083317.1 glutamate-5-semialdehyde dehydrogenase [Zhihengliuella flava]